MTFRPSPRRGLRSAWPWLLVFGAAALWMFGSRPSSGPQRGEPAPDLSLPWTASEEPFDLAAQRGQVTVLAFWATWCPACRAEGPALGRLHERIAPEGDKVVAVSLDTAPLDSIASAARGFGMTGPIAKGSRDDASRFSVEVLPTIVVVDSNGRVAETFTGTVGESRLLEAVETARAMR